MPVPAQVINPLDSCQQHVRLVDSLNTAKFLKCFFITRVKSDSVLNTQLTTNCEPM